MHSDTSSTISQHGWRNPHDPKKDKKTTWDNYNEGSKGAQTTRGGVGTNAAGTHDGSTRSGGVGTNPSGYHDGKIVRSGVGTNMAGNHDGSRTSSGVGTNPRGGHDGKRIQARKAPKTVERMLKKGAKYQGPKEGTDHDIKNLSSYS